MAVEKMLMMVEVMVEVERRVKAEVVIMVEVKRAMTTARFLILLLFLN